MAITASGYYSLTLEKQLIDTAAFSLENASAVSVLMVLDAHDGAVANYDTHADRADITQEVSGGGYTAGGQAVVSPALTVATPAAAQMNYDTNDPSWAASTITNAMAAVIYNSTGVAANDLLVSLSDFVTAASTSNGTFTIAVDTNGWWYLDLSP